MGLFKKSKEIIEDIDIEFENACRYIIGKQVCKKDLKILSRADIFILRRIFRNIEDFNNSGVVKNG